MGWDDLPAELLYNILQSSDSSHVKTCVDVCHNWALLLTPYLYSSPKIASTDKYLLLTETILSSTRNHGSLVRVLNLGKVIGTLKTVRLPELMRACPNLREFYAPQAAFTPYMMQAVPFLTQLRVMDLACCIERFEISRLINHCASLRHLHTFRYPRCSVSTLYPIKGYPPNLRHFSLRGGLKDDFVMKMAGPGHPHLSIESLQVIYAPAITAPPILKLISTLRGLQHLEISWPLMRFNHNALDSLLDLVPGLTSLVIAVDYISPRFFELGHCSLASLELRFSGVGKHRILNLDDLMESFEDEEHYPNLRLFVVAKKLGDLMFRDHEAYDQLKQVCANRAIRLVDVEDGMAEDSYF